MAIRSYLDSKRHLPVILRIRQRGRAELTKSGVGVEKGVSENSVVLVATAEVERIASW
jgi:hypothetical protein